MIERQDRVEISPHFPARQVPSGDREARQLDPPRREEGLLNDPGDLALSLVRPGVVDRQRDAVGEGLQETNLVRRELARALGEDLDDPDHPPADTQGDGHGRIGAFPPEGGIQCSEPGRVRHDERPGIVRHTARHALSPPEAPAFRRQRAVEPGRHHQIAGAFLDEPNQPRIGVEGRAHPLDERREQLTQANGGKGGVADRLQRVHLGDVARQTLAHLVERVPQLPQFVAAAQGHPRAQVAPPERPRPADQGEDRGAQFGAEDPGQKQAHPDGGQHRDHLLGGRPAGGFERRRFRLHHDGRPSQSGDGGGGPQIPGAAVAVSLDRGFEAGQRRPDRAQPLQRLRGPRGLADIDDQPAGGVDDDAVGGAPEPARQHRSKPPEVEPAEHHRGELLLIADRGRHLEGGVAADPVRGPGRPLLPVPHRAHRGIVRKVQGKRLRRAGGDFGAGGIDQHQREEGGILRPDGGEQLDDPRDRVGLARHGRAGGALGLDRAGEEHLDIGGHGPRQVPVAALHDLQPSLVPRLEQQAPQDEDRNHADQDDCGDLAADAQVKAHVQPLRAARARTAVRLTTLPGDRR